MEADDSCILNNDAKITDFIIVVNLDLGMATGLFQITQLSQKKKNGRSMQAKCIYVFQVELEI